MEEEKKASGKPRGPSVKTAPDATVNVVAKSARKDLHLIETESIEKFDDQLSTTSLERDIANLDKLRAPLGESRELALELDGQSTLYGGSRQSSRATLLTRERLTTPPGGAATAI